MLLHRFALLKANYDAETKNREKTMISRKKSDSTHPTPDMNWDHKTHSNASTWLNLHNLGLIHKFQSKK